MDGRLSRGREGPHPHAHPVDGDACTPSEAWWERFLFGKDRRVLVRTESRGRGASHVAAWSAALTKATLGSRLTTYVTLVRPFGWDAPGNQLKYFDFAEASMHLHEEEPEIFQIYHEADSGLLRLEPETFDEVWEDAVEALRERRSVILSTKRMVRASPSCEGWNRIPREGVCRSSRLTNWACGSDASTYAWVDYEQDAGSAQHAIDFLSGCTLVLWGKVEDLGDGQFLFVTPDEEVRRPDIVAITRELCCSDGPP